MKKLLSFLFIFFLAINLRSGESQTITKTEALAAFAKVYGPARYFCPTVQSASLDWEKFAVYGVEKVQLAKNQEELKKILDELYSPIVPDIQFNKTRIFRAMSIDTTGKDIRFWQHFGLGMDQNSIYKSSLINDKSRMSRSEDFGAVRSLVDITKYGGKEFKLSAWVKMEVAGFGNEGHLWCGVGRKSGKQGFFDNMAYDPIKDSSWKEYTITGTFDEDAYQLNFGAFLSGHGKMWMDNFKLEVKTGDQWKSVKLSDATFERTKTRELANNWFTKSINYQSNVITDEAYKGKKSLEIKSINKHLRGMIFKRTPDLAYLTNIKLFDSLYCQFDVAILHKRDEKTLLPAFNNLVAELDQINLLYTSGAAQVMQVQNTDIIQGEAVRIRAKFRESLPASSSLAKLGILFVDAETNLPINYEEKIDMIHGTKWEELVASTTVPDNSTNIVVSAGLIGEGKLQLDDVWVEQLVQGKWFDIGFANLSFENTGSGQSLGGWVKSGLGYDIRAIEGNALKGRKYLLFENDTRSIGAENKNVRLANFVIVWNVLNEFYPYFEDTPMNMNFLLHQGIDQVFDSKYDYQFTNVMKSFTEQFSDGHADFVSHEHSELTRRLPILCKMIDNQIVVVKSMEDLLKKGDILVSVDSIPVIHTYDTEIAFVSASDQFKNPKYFVNGFSQGRINSKAKVQIKRGDEEMEFELVRNNNSPMLEYDYPSLQKMSGGVYLINLTKITMKEFRDNLDQLRNAKGIIFDARGYVDFEKRDILSYLSDKDLESPKWLVPELIYPNQDSLQFSETTWTIKPQTPRIKCPTALLVSGSSMSATETFVAIYKHYELGKVIGQRTAGTNGNVNSYRNLPGGFTFSFTGMRVLNHDGSRFHLLGITPDIEIEETYEDLLENRDPSLIKAMEVLGR
jgi:C-terminal processing protease CtpA/Prc